MNPLTKQQEATRAFDFKQLKISSTAFQDGDYIPAKYTCDGANINPPLHIEGIPEEAKSLAIVVDDPDAPGKTWVHWVVWNIPVTHQIKENVINGMQGINDFGDHKYGGPCPPRGTHHYYFKIYALNSVLELPVSAGKNELEKAMSEYIIAFGEIIGLYKRN